MLSGLLDLVGNAIVSCLVGAVPEREPWRTIVTSLYVLGALGGIAVLVWAVTQAI